MARGVNAAFAGDDSGFLDHRRDHHWAKRGKSHVQGKLKNSMSTHQILHGNFQPPSLVYAHVDLPD